MSQTQNYHKFNTKTYVRPTYCYHCNKLLVGIIRQGVRCEGCKQDYHKTCIHEIQRDCLGQNSNERKGSFRNSMQGGKRERSDSDRSLKSSNASGFSNEQGSYRFSQQSNKQSMKSNVGDTLGALSIQDEQSSTTDEPDNQHLYHRFVTSTFSDLTRCEFCSHTLIGIVRQGVKCEICDQAYHKRCIENLPNKICDKLISLHNQSSKNNAEESEVVVPPKDRCTLDENPNKIKVNTIIETEEKEEIDNFFVPEIDSDSSDLENTEKNIENDNSLDVVSPVVSKEKSSELMEAAKISKKTRYTQKSKQIKVGRVSERIRKKEGIFWSGFMVFYTKTNPEIGTRYWKLTSKILGIYKSYNEKVPLVEITLASFTDCHLCGIDLNNKKDEYIDGKKCCFILSTDSETYYCGLDPALRSNSMNILAGHFFNMFKMAYLPFRKTEGKSIDNKDMFNIAAPNYEIERLEDKYKISPDDLLGSGQFGQVYAGTDLKTKGTVAIKAIEKAAFMNKNDPRAESNIFQNEFTLLTSITHPGIIKLFALFDEKEYLYVVTEKLSVDMLDKILSLNPARLKERQSKFYIYQILSALDKLHKNNIAHCDLKPENILLVQNEDFPQLKICDFGYAKIIGDGSMRRSLVGTPAYSPPEVNGRKRVYNNSMDMWSMGVIMYVSLSGTFPFEEDKDIESQLMNFKCLFGPDPWAWISKESIDVIQRLLQVKLDRRLTATKTLDHSCFKKDKQLYKDLINLEQRVGQKWLIDQKWEIE